MSTNIDLDAVHTEHDAFPQTFQTLLLATVGSSGEPNASYAPYVRKGTDFYVYVSELAAHTKNLREQAKASVFFIEDESESRNLFARRRSTFQCTAQLIPRDEIEFEQIIECFAQKFGNTMEILKTMQDFHLFKLHPLKATYVAGFARAFVVEGETLNKVSHVNDVGHRNSARENDRRIEA